MERTQMNRDEGIRQLAYGLWQEEGCPEGREIEHWLRAQTIWEEINGAHGKAKQSRAANGRKAKPTRRERQL